MQKLSLDPYVDGTMQKLSLDPYVRGATQKSVGMTLILKAQSWHPGCRDWSDYVWVESVPQVVGIGVTLGFKHNAFDRDFQAMTTFAVLSVMFCPSSTHAGCTSQSIAIPGIQQHRL